MDGTKFISNKSKATSVLYFIIYAVACFVYWQSSTNNHQTNDSWADIHAIAVDHPLVYVNTKDLLKSAMEHNPNNIQLRSTLEAVQKLEVATKTLDYQLSVSCQQQPDNATHLINHAKFLIEQGKYPEAEEHLIKAIAISPTFGKSEILLMKIYHHSENWNQLQKLALEVSRTKTNMLVAKRYLKIAKKKETVINILEENLRNNSTPQNHLMLSKELYNTKRFAESLHHARLALQMKKNFSNARLMLGLAYHKLGQKQNAIKALKPGLQFNSELQLIQQKLSSLEYSSNTALAYQ
nr:tetratricopeptide repeat protein [uncultured Allomuricauda sp.]